MTTTVKSNAEIITTMLNGVYVSINNVLPLEIHLEKPTRQDKHLDIEFGVLIGFTGDVKGKLVIGSRKNVFGTIAEKMYGMPLEGEMLSSFSGELGNMIAGGLATYNSEKGIESDITYPTVMDGKTTLSGYSKALRIPTSIESVGDIMIYLLLD
ncbi:chemotaxis protein CheX [Salirhabdus sp. Marseille-P4669]|uniref:chemotaxis protein CheX n=1 Tax=Salirhabdus sp. Marseille-P4669 TaxID=2042310 RepID=UPI000C7E0B34|nr:chemotaxis protein CheX [Salirhabdus sp. Marseille-P4669]